MKPKNNPIDHTKHIARIQKVFSDPITSWVYHDDGFDNHAYEINDIWIFKIPKRDEIWSMLKRERDFLNQFHDVSPIPVPKFTYSGNRIVGYQKLHGEQLSKNLLQSMSVKEKDRLATDIGTFLSSLHNLSVSYIMNPFYRRHFTRWWFDLLIRKTESMIYPHISNQIQQHISSFVAEMSKDSRNFQHIYAPVHNDLNPSHLLWDRQTGRLNGVIDFGEVCHTAITADFTMFTDFCDSDNDPFLQNILSVYNCEDSGLYRKIKLFSYIEKLHSAVEDYEYSVLDPSKRDNFEKSIEDVVKAFSVVPRIPVSA